MGTVHTDVNELVARCARQGGTLAVAESCTGGLIAHLITNVPGASAVFLGGVVAYANETKAGTLHVPQELLAANGAVSEPVALAMATGVRRLLGADFGIAVTGIAGPGGGVPGKPVGTVYLSVAGPTRERTTRRMFTGDRAAVKAQTADAALALLLESMESL